MPKMLEITQQMRFGFTKEGLLEIIQDRPSIKKYILIIHDKDVYDHDVKDDDGNITHSKGEKKAPHFHAFLSFGSTNVSFEQAAKWFNVEPQYTLKIKGRYADAVKYALHLNAPEKYQYSPEDACANFDILDYIKREDEKQAQKVEIDSIIDRIGNEEIKYGEIGNYIPLSLYVNDPHIKYQIDDAFQYVAMKYIDKIINGEIKRYNVAQIIDGGLYSRFRTKFESAFKTQLDRKKRERNRDMKCIFITGDSGSGKTTYAKQIAEQRHLDYFVSSGSNDPLDSYSDEPCIILDDLRPSCMGLSDLLKMLDNNTASTVKSRYYNKYIMCDLIIITTTLSIDNFFNQVFQEEKETIIQLKRRCSVLMTMTVDTVSIQNYDPALREYTKPITIPNPVKYIVKEPKTQDEILDDITSIIGVSKDVLLQAEKELKENREAILQQIEEEKAEQARIEAERQRVKLNKDSQRLDNTMKQLGFN